MVDDEADEATDDITTDIVGSGSKTGFESCPLYHTARRHVNRTIGVVESKGPVLISVGN